MAIHDSQSTAVVLDPPGGRSSTAGVGHFGQLLKDLRDARGLTQDQLADAAHVSGQTIRRAEASETCPWKRSNALAVYRALQQRAPLTPRERDAYLEATNLKGLAEHAVELAAAVAAPARSLLRSPIIQATMKLRAFTDTLPPDQARAFWQLADLLDTVGAAAVLKMLEASATMADSEAHVRRVVGPPVQREGYVEQVITEYQTPPAQSKEQPPQAAKRRTS
jgi:transcriptional regulator with XRE-family HTH domain